MVSTFQSFFSILVGMRAVQVRQSELKKRTMKISINKKELELLDEVLTLMIDLRSKGVVSMTMSSHCAGLRGKLRYHAMIAAKAKQSKKQKQ